MQGGIFMSFEEYNCIKSIDDDRDSVIYNKGKVINYWDDVTKRYRVWATKNSVKLWKDFDSYELMEGKLQDIGRLYLLINSIDNDNIICIYDKSKRKYRPAKNKNELLDIVKSDFNKSQGRTFLKTLFDKDIVKKIIIVPNDVSQEYTERYFINPLITMGTSGLSIICYKLFREHLIPYLSDRAISNLDRHLQEEFV